MSQIELPTIDFSLDGIKENLGFYICVVFGLITLIISLIKLAILKIKYTCTIEAKLTKYAEMYSNKSILYAPVYTYKYNKCSYDHPSTEWSKSKKYEIGRTIKLHINPEAPAEVRGSSIKHIFGLLIGICLVLLSVSVFLPK